MAGFTQEQLDKIHEAMADPTLSVQFRDRRVQRRSYDELLKAKQTIEDDLISQGAGPARIKQYRMRTSKGV